MATLQELLDELPRNIEAIPLPVIREIVNAHVGPWDRDQQSYAVKAGVIRPLPERVGSSHAFAVDHDEAVKILVAAALAFVAGCAIVAMLRAIDGAGLDVGALIRAMA